MWCIHVMDLCKHTFVYINVCVCIERRPAGGRIVQSAERAFTQAERGAHGIRQPTDGREERPAESVTEAGGGAAQIQTEENHR